jgi:hypothetical protein
MAEQSINRLKQAAKAIGEMETENELRAGMSWLWSFFLEGKHIQDLRARERAKNATAAKGKRDGRS